jgi:hypothetical protein
VEPRGINDQHAVRSGRHRPGQPQSRRTRATTSRTDPTASASSCCETRATSRPCGRAGWTEHDRNRDNGCCGLSGVTPRRTKLKASMRSRIVVVPQVLVEDPLKVATPPDQHPVQALLSDRPHPPLRDCVGVRRLDGVLMIRVPSEMNTSPKARVNLLSRSRTRNRGTVVPSAVSHSRSINSSRARWTTHDLLGWSVTPTRRTRRVPSSIMNKTCSVVRRTVSTVKKSVATMPAACARRNARQLTDARRGAAEARCRAAPCGWWSPISRPRAS